MENLVNSRTTPKLTRNGEFHNGLTCLKEVCTHLSSRCMTSVIKGPGLRPVVIRLLPGYVLTVVTGVGLLVASSG